MSNQSRIRTKTVGPVFFFLRFQFNLTSATSGTIEGILYFPQGHRVYFHSTKSVATHFLKFEEKKTTKHCCDIVVYKIESKNENVSFQTWEYSRCFQIVLEYKIE